MLQEQLRHNISELLGDRARFQVPLKDLTTWKIGGPAWCVCSLHNQDEALELFKLLREVDMASMPLGNGSNLLFSERGYQGVLYSLQGTFQEITFKDNLVITGAGAQLGNLLSACAHNGLSGLEWAAAIPATVGGAVAMNAGSVGEDIFTKLRSIKLLLPDCAIVELKADYFQASYRNGNLPRGALVLQVVFQLAQSSPHKIKDKIHNNVVLKKNHFPLNWPNAGSVFKNPEGDFAGRLIEQAGLKGKICGNAQISAVHANFIVNLGNAKADEVLELIRLAQTEVLNKYGIKLEPEVRIID